MPMKRALSVLALSLLAACSSATDVGTDTAGIRVRTDQRLYGLPAGGTTPVTAPFTATNSGSAPVFVARCGSAPAAELQRRENGEWSTVSSGVCTANVEMSPVQILPGASLSGLVSAGRISGIYRVRVPVGDSPATLTSYAVSPTFEVRWTDG
jgi:hypothetical protein